MLHEWACSYYFDAGYSTAWVCLDGVAWEEQTCDARRVSRGTVSLSECSGRALSFDYAFLNFRLFMVAQILSKAIVLIFCSQKTRYTFLYWSQKVLDRSIAPAVLNRYYLCIFSPVFIGSSMSLEGCFLHRLSMLGSVRLPILRY